MAHLLALLLLSTALHHTQAFFQGETNDVTCTLYFHLDPDATKFELSGAVEEPISTVLTSSEDRIGATGVLQVSYEAEGSCPKDASAVFEAVESSFGAGAVEIAAPALVQVFPGVLSATFDASYSALRIGGLRFGLEGGLRMKGAEGAGLPDVKYFETNASVTSVTSRAWVGSTEPGVLISIDGNTAETEGMLEGYVSIENDTISLGFLEIDIKAGVAGPVLDSKNESVISGIVQLKGSIVSKAIVGCKPECGKNGHGKCGKKETGDFTCLCECAWTGPNCEVPKGFCPAYSDLLEDLSSSCEGRQQLDPSTRECTRCMDGWKGATCNSCTNDQVCNAFWGDDNMKCTQAPEFLSQTQYKVFSCDFKDSGYRSFVGDNIEFACNTTGLPLGDDVLKSIRQEDFHKEGPWCELSLTWLAKTPVKCIATECEMSVNSTRGFCAKGVCECEGGPCTGDAQEVFGAGVSNIELVCSKGEGSISNCELAFGSLAGIKLTAPCFVSECLDPDAEASLGNSLRRKKEGEFRWELILLGVPLYAAIILGACLGCPAWVFHRKVSHPPAEYVYGGSVRQLDASQETSEIVVPKRKTAEEKKEDGGVLRKLSTMSMGGLDDDSDQPKNPLPQLKGLTHEVIEMLQPPRNGFKTVLQDVSCTFRTGEMVAIMGPSGCGKSTFLSVLSGMSLFGTSQRIVTGRIMVNGKKRGSWIKKIAVFVPQEDNIMAMLTVRECLTYSAILRLPVTTSMDTVFKRVFSSLTELGLERVADSQVGGIRGIRGISGGERRRVTIGMEMVTRPKIILMDEPTSGLDSHTALSLTTLLKNISQQGRLVMFSVHQPSPVMFSKLDKVLLLANGFSIYLGAPQDIDGFFKRYGRPVPRGTHSAEHMLAVVSRPRTLVPLLNSIFALNNRADEEAGQGDGRPTVRRAMHSVIMEGELNKVIPPDPEDLGLFAKIMMYLRKSVLHLQVTFWRGFVDIARNPVLLLAHWVMAIIMGVGLGLIFFDVQKDFSGAQNRLGGFFFCLAFLAFTSSTTVEVLHAERTVVLREVKAGYYSPLPYLLSKIILDALLLRAIPALLLGIPYYKLSGLESDASKFFTFLFTASTFNMTVGAISMTLAILIMNSGAASLVINIVILVSLLFANFPANSGTIPSPLAWINHISFIGYGLRIMAVNEIDGSVFEIKADENLPAVNLNSDIILNILGFSPNRFTRDTIAMVGMCFTAMLMVVVSLWLRAKVGEFQKLLNKVMWLRHKKAIMKKKEKAQAQAQAQRRPSTNSTLEMLPGPYGDASQTRRSQTDLTRSSDLYV